MWNESSCSLETTATLYFFTGCEEWKQSSQLWKEGTSYQEESQCSCDSKRLAAQTGMDVITCFCSDTSMQSSRKSQCFPRNWKGRSLGVGDTGQCWVLPQTSIMRNSFLARTPRFMHGFELEEETGKWASPSQLNVGAITLLLKSGYLSCWLVVRVIFDSLRTQPEVGCEGLILSAWLCPSTLIKGLFWSLYLFVLQKQEGENYGKWGPIHHILLSQRPVASQPETGS